MISEPKRQLNSIGDMTKNRLWLKCKKTSNTFLIDSGAEISVVQKSFQRYANPISTTTTSLFAANGTPIKTYGMIHLSVDFNLRRDFSYDFIVADVECNIIGADFLKHFNLLVDIGQKRLVDSNTRLFTIGQINQNNVQRLSTIDNNLNDNIKSILKQYPSVTKEKVFTEAKHDVKHYIITSSNQPIACKPNRLTPEKLKMAKCEIEKLLKRGIIQPSSSPWSSRMTMVKKKDNTWRICGDFRSLNQITIPDRYPMPHIHDFTQSISAQLFTTLDIVSAYYNIPMNQQDIEKTAMITPFGLFEYKVMPFGLRNSAQTYQRFMDRIFAGIENVFIYVDDILIASQNHDEHMSTLKKVFEILDRNGLTVNTKKCSFLKEQVTFLGHCIDKNGVSTSPEKLKAINEFPKPTSKKSLKRFLGMINFYRRFIPNAAQTLSPLYDLDKSATSNDLEWNEQTNKSFEEIKTKITNLVQLAYIDENAKLILKTDASDIAIGAVLEQISNNQPPRPIGFFSRRLRPNEKSYSTFDKELMAIFRSIKHFEYLLTGRQFTVFTDHKPIVTAIKKTNNKSPKQIRMISYILEFVNEIQYLKGDINYTADTLSRVEIDSVDNNNLNLDEIADCQKVNIKDEDLSEITANVIRNLLPNGKTLLCHVTNGISKPIIPEPLKQRVFHLVHDLAHPSIRSTRKEIAKRFYWKNLNTDVNNMARQCLACQSSKIQRHVKTKSVQLPIPSGRFKHIDIDIVGPLPETKEGYRYILTIIDRFSRWMEALKMRNIETETVITNLIDGWISRFGIPEQIRTDRGRQFESHLFTRLNEIFGINRIKTAAYCPRSNGMIERLHRTLKNALKTSNEKEWDIALPWTLLGLRTIYKEEINSSTAEMLYGEPISVPADLIDAEERRIMNNEELLNKIRTAITKFSSTLSRPSNQKQYIPKQLKNCEYVWIRKENLKSLEKPYIGPYKVNARNHSTFNIQTNIGNEDISIHRLKPATCERHVSFNIPRRRGRPRKGEM